MQKHIVQVTWGQSLSGRTVSVVFLTRRELDKSTRNNLIVHLFKKKQLSPAFRLEKKDVLQQEEKNSADDLSHNGMYILVKNDGVSFNFLHYFYHKCVKILGGSTSY